MQVQLDEILTPELLTEYRQHIIDFLEMEGIAPADDLGQTQLNERTAKELLAEMAHDAEQDEQR